MMEFLNELLSNTQHSLPIVAAFVLGLMTAISPCPLATNITAIAYIGKDIQEKRKIFYHGLIYTLGRAISYTLLGLIIFLGASTFAIGNIFSTYGEKLLGPLLFIIGIFMQGIITINFPGFGKITDKFNNNKAGFWSVLLMGIVFALAFCPYSGILYFGMLIPMTVASAQGLILPPVFALATGLPVIIIAYLLAFTIAGVGSFYNKMKSFEYWFRKVVAFIFIIAGVVITLCAWMGVCVF